MRFRVSGRVPVSLFLLTVGACTKAPNPLYCDELADCDNGEFCNLDTHNCQTHPPDADTRCSTDEQCANANAATPICGDDQMCRGCGLDGECPSGVCRPDGACEPAGSVLYVAPNGAAAGQCPSTEPCELFYARSLVTESRKSIHLSAGTYALGSDFIISSPISELVLVGPRSAIMQRTSSGPVLDVRSATLTVRGIAFNRGLACSAGVLNIQQASFGSPGAENRPWVFLTNCEGTISGSELIGSTNYGVNAELGKNLTIDTTRIEGSALAGVRANGSKLTINGSILVGNMGLGVDSISQMTAIHRNIVHMNRAGGVSSVGGLFDVTNNHVTYNGNDTNGAFGGMRLDTTLPGNRVEHNTIVRNDSQVNHSPLYAGGLYCRGGGSAWNNLIANNFAGNTEQPHSQIGGTCDLQYSRISPDDLPERLGGSLDKMVLTTTSPALNAGSTSLTPVTVDFDGQPRSDGMPDIGADEL